MLITALNVFLTIGETPVNLWWFSTCGASGPRGPTQAQCDSAYQDTNMISAYGAAGGKGAKNHNKRSHGIFISANFQLEKDELLYMLVGQQGEDACLRINYHTKQICLGESSEIEEEYKKAPGLTEWAGGGGGGGGATYVFRQKDGAFEPLLVAAGGGGKAYLKAQESSLDDGFLEQYVNSSAIPGVSGRTGA
ncbi:hypothetical protein E2320_021250, partial [Naja naja]